MVRKVEILAKLGVLAAVALLAPAQAHAQVSFRGAGYFGGGSSLGGGYSFERFSIFSWGNPWFSQGYGWPSGYGMPYGYGYGMPYGYGYGMPYGYGYGFELSPIPYPYLTTASYPFFTYVTSDQNSPAPKTIEPGKYIRPPVESRPSDDSRSGLVPSAEPRGARDTRQPIVYRADVPRHADVKQTQTRSSRLVVTRSTAP